MTVEIPKEEVEVDVDKSEVDKSPTILERAKSTFISFRDSIRDRWLKFSKTSSKEVPTSESGDLSSDKKMKDRTVVDSWGDDSYSIESEDAGKKSKISEKTPGDDWDLEEKVDTISTKIEEKTPGDGWDLEEKVDTISTKSEETIPGDEWDLEEKVDTISTKIEEEISGDDLDLEEKVDKIPTEAEYTEEFRQRLALLGFPKSVDEIKADRYLGGSSGVIAGFVEGDANSELFVVKKARRIEQKEPGGGISESLNTGQLVEGHIADRIYSALGFNVPPSVIYEKGLSRVSKYIPGKDFCSLDDLHNTEEIADEIRKGFVLDCFLGNWDVIGGLGGDNIRVGFDGKVYRLDNDGSLDFRARGERKPESDFNYEVKELDTMRARNAIFSAITDSEILAQIDHLLANEDKIFEAFDTVLEELGLDSFGYLGLKSLLRERIYYLSKYGIQIEKKNFINSMGDFLDKDDLAVVEGVPDNIISVINTNIRKSLEYNWNNYAEFSKINGLSTIEYINLLQEEFEKSVTSSHIFRATAVGIIEKVLLDDERFKSQFETGTSGGSFNLRARSEAEEKMFGYSPDNTPKENRPIYAYYSDAPHGEINYQGKNPPENLTRQYGRVTFKIKDSVKERATLTNQDSLGTYYQNPPTPFLHPHFTSVDVTGRVDNIRQDFKSSSVRSYYSEVQVHGGIRAGDIEKIYVSKDNGLIESQIEFVKGVVEEYNKRNPDNKIILEEY